MDGARWNISVVAWDVRVSCARRRRSEAFGRLIYHADGLATTVTVERTT